ncbi:MAG: aminopeptidase [Thermoplasmata archaeon]|nr:aminopeptidase [Thermoplasmata archaeon]
MPSKHSEKKLEKSALATVKNALAVKRGERVLIVTNPSEDVLAISTALYRASAERGAKPVMCIQPRKTQVDFMEKIVRRAIETEPEVVMSISEMKLGKDEEALTNPYVVNGKEYTHIFDAYMAMKKIRTIWTPGITRKIFERAVDINYGKMARDAEKLARVFEGAGAVHIQSNAGTDVEIGIEGRKPKRDDGNYRVPGTGGNIPAGEVYISPAIGKTDGTVVFDGSISTYWGDVVTGKPVRVEFRGGYGDTITGGNEARMLQKSIALTRKKVKELEKSGKFDTNKAEIYLKNATHLGEIGIGLNPAAVICGNMLEDEKVYGTCHLAIGANFDEDAPALNHYDCLIKKPTIRLLQKGEWVQIMKNGVLKI